MTATRLLALGLILYLLTLACTGGAQGEPSRNGVTIAVSTPTPGPARAATPTSTPSPPPTVTATPSPNVCLFNPDPATQEELQVLSPSLGENQQVLEVKSPLHVVGWSSDIRRGDVDLTIAVIELADDELKLLPIFDTEGAQVLTVDATPLSASGQTPPPGLKVTEFTAPFAENVGFRVEQPKPACLWVFIQPVGSSDARDVVQVPLRLLP